MLSYDYKTVEEAQRAYEEETCAACVKHNPRCAFPVSFPAFSSWAVINLP